MKRQTSLGTQLRELIYLLDSGVDTCYRDEGVDFRARFYPVFVHLMKFGPSPMSGMLDTSGTTLSAISQTVSQMERLGLVRLEPGQDKRIKIVSLTPKAEGMRGTLEPIWERVHAAADDLNHEIGIDLPDVLMKLTNALCENPFQKRIQTRKP